MTNDVTNSEDVQFYSDLLRAFFDSANDAIFVLCDEMKFLNCNKTTQKWLGYTEDELTAHNKRTPITELLGNPEAIDFFKSSFIKALDNNEVLFETLINPLNGSERWIELNMKRVDIENGDMVIAVARDITQRKENKAIIEYKSNYDQLTGLPNRNNLQQNFLSDSVSTYNSTKTLTILNIDLDRFKEINESLGYAVGDNILQEIARRLTKVIDCFSNGSVARLEGDEFVLVLPGADVEIAYDIAVKAKELVTEPFEIGFSKIGLDCSIGIASYPQHTKDKSKLIQYAESAMYSAKADKLGIGIYDPEKFTSTTERLQLITELRQAVTNNEIRPYYQPIINIKYPDQIRLEVLARWEHKVNGFVSPEIFIQLAEEIGIINQLTSTMLSSSLEQCSALLNENIIKNISVNISTYSITNPDIVEEIKALVNQYNIKPDQVIFEITESSAMQNTKTTEGIIKELHQFGIQFSIDDFGTGYSSLSKFKQLPLSELKIDKSFILEMPVNENDKAIATASIEMAHALGLEVVAEGIENKTTWNMLKTMGCDYGQGFWMSKALPYHDLLNWLDTAALPNDS